MAADEGAADTASEAVPAILREIKKTKLENVSCKIWGVELSGFFCHSDLT